MTCGREIARSSAWHIGLRHPNAGSVTEDMRRAGNTRSLSRHTDGLFDALERLPIPFDHIVGQRTASRLFKCRICATVDGHLRATLIRLFAPRRIEVNSLVFEIDLGPGQLQDRTHTDSRGEREGDKQPDMRCRDVIEQLVKLLSRQITIPRRALCRNPNMSVTAPIFEVQTCAEIFQLGANRSDRRTLPIPIAGILAAIVL